MTNQAYIEQSIGGVYEPLLTVRPRYVADQINGIRGRRSRLRIIPPVAAMNIKASGISAQVRKELIGSGLSSMLITNVSYSFVEKTQLHETFGDSLVLYAFGMSPIALNISGVVMDDLDNNWFVKLIYAYNDFIRATKLAKNFEIVRLDMPDATFIGSILNLSINRDSGNDALVPFSMQFLVRNFEFYSTQTYSNEDLKHRTNIEDVANDGVFAYKTLKDGKVLKETVDKLSATGSASAAAKLKDSIFGGVGNTAKKLVGNSVSSLGNSAGGAAISKVNTASASGIDKVLSDAYKKFSSSISLDKLLGDNLLKNVGNLDVSESRPYVLKIIGMYSRQLELAQEDSAVSTFIGNIAERTAVVNSTIAYITGTGQTSSEMKAKKESLTKTVNLTKKIMDLATGKRQLNIDSIGELGETGKALKGTLGKVAALPTTLSDSLGKLVQNSPISSLPFVGSIAGGVVADQADKYLRGKVPKDVKDFLRVPAKEPTKSRIIRVGLSK